jgi:phage shock protein PspC (stress-responsive transcriptional regulator)
MEKTVSITIGRVVFMIEEDAYGRLEKYLSSLKAHFASLVDKQEIIDDIESRIAEKFSEMIKEGKRQAVNLSDVEEIIISMGEAADMPKGESGEKKQEKEEGFSEDKDSGPKRFFRNPDDMVIAGVSSGLAAYFGIDPVIVRLIFILLTVFGGGSGILIYIILWVITPEAKTASEKLEMRGKSVTIEKIEKSVKETLEKSKINKTELRHFVNRFADVLRKIFSLLGKALSRVFPILGMIIGIALIVSGVLAILGICFSAAAAIFNFNSPYINLPVLAQYGGTTLYNVSVVAVSLVALIPLVFIFLLGVALVGGKSIFNVFVSSFLLAVWMMSIIAVGVLGMRFAPEIQNKVEEMKSVPAVEETRDYALDHFDRIYADGIEELVIRQGDNSGASSEGASADLQKLNLEVKDGELRVTRDPSAMFPGRNRAARVTIILPEIKNIRLDGMVKAQMGPFRQTNLFLELNGLAKLEFSAEIADRLVVRMNGLSEARALGSARVSEVSLDGSAKYYAQDLLSSYGTFRLDGTSRAEINASDYIKIESFGVSYASYSGSAKAEIIARDVSKIEYKEK